MVDNVGSGPSNRPGDSSEGVRIIGPEEAAQAMQRGDVVARRSDSERHGNRPQPPPVGPRPSLRFPLDEAADPQQLDKPAVRSPAPKPTRSWGAPIAPDAITPDAIAPDAIAPDAITPDAITPDAIPPDAPAAETGTDDDTMPGGPGGPPTAGPATMQHWTAPPTGEVPAVLGSDTGDEEEDLDAWSSFASSSARWHDNDWDQGGFDDVSAIGGDDTRVGAMDSSRPTNEEIFSFDELDEQATASRGATSDPDPAPEEIPDFRFDATLTQADRPPSQVEPAAAAPGIPSRVKAMLARVRPRAGTGDAGEPAGEQAPPAPRSARRSQRRRLGSPHRDTPPPPEEPGIPERPARSGSDVGKRILVGFALMGVLGAALAIGSAVTLGLVVLVMAIAALEFFNSVRQVGYQPAVFPGLLATVLLPISVYYRGLDAVPLVLALTVIFGMLWYLVGADGGDGRLVEGMGLTMFGVGWIGVLGSFAAAMLRLEDGRGMLMAAVLATVAYDIAGFFVGRSSAGTTPLIAISPNKTREGLIGGMVVCLLMCVGIIGLAPSIAPFDGWQHGLALFAFAALAAPLGDLCESLVKRDLGLKDMGALLPGHGGLLDRIDGLLFVLPATYFCLVLFSIGPFAR